MKACPSRPSTPIPVPYTDLSNPQTLNLYRYPSNPETVADPDGHEDPIATWIFGTDDPVQAAKNIGNGLLKYANNTVGLLERIAGHGMDGGPPRPMLAPDNQGEYTGMNLPTIISALSEESAVGSTVNRVAGVVEKESTEAGESATAGEAAAAKNTPTVQMNKAAGDAFRDELAAGLKAEGRDVTKEVTKRTPFGPRRIDIEVKHNGRILGGVETKVGKSPYKPSQRAKDAYLKQKGYPVDVVRKPADQK